MLIRKVLMASATSSDRGVNEPPLHQRPASLRSLLIALGLVGALALPGAVARAAGHGGHGKGRHHGWAYGHHHGNHGHGLHQLEGMVVSVAPDGSSMVIQPLDTDAVTLTVTISTTGPMSTVITAADGVTTTTLAAGEQVHVAATELNGAYTAVRVLIQKQDAEAKTDDADSKPRGSSADGKPKH